MVAVVVAVAVAVAVVVVAVTDMVTNNHTRLVLQFHITGRCNLRCKHCYRTKGDVEPLSLSQIIEVMEQFKELQRAYYAKWGIKAKGHINITGGEPFMREDIDEILTYLGENRQSFTYGVLSNGSFIDEDMMALLKQTGVSFVQLSIDGDQPTHDALRAKGDYERVFGVAQTLEENGIATYISFTAHQGNYQHLPLVAKECRKRKVTKLWSDRMVPIGNGEQLQAMEITEKELPLYLKALKKAQGNWLTKGLHKKTTVTMNRALQFQNSKGVVYSCSGGNRLITVDEEGNIMPCRRMPIVCGNVTKTTLSQVYFQNEIFQQLRLPTIPKECGDCRYRFLCQGGAKCQSYAKTGSFFSADPGCPFRNKT